jgi:small subunit ribosomal protein S8e
MEKGRKKSGGKYKTFRKRKKYEIPGQIRVVKLRETRKKILRVSGGNFKTVLLSDNYANVFNPETKKAKKVKIINVLETPSNKFLARQNILTKSAIIETELGKARITNKPSEEAMIQAILINK